MHRTLGLWTTGQRIGSIGHGSPVPVTAAVPARLRSCAFRGSRAVAAGLLSSDQLRGPTWRALYRDIYVHRDVPVDHALRARAALLLVPGALVSGRSAAVLWGVDLLDADDDVELTVPPGGGPVRVGGLRVHRRRLPDGWATRVGGVPVTSPEATALLVAATAPTDNAVVDLDRLVRARTVLLDEVRAVAATWKGHGSARARAACALADGLAESPQETRLRLLVVRSGLPRPVAQYVVEDGGRFVARVDFAWPDQRLALEYDGAWHGEPGQFARDRQRLNRLQAAGWRLLFVTAGDLGRPEELVARIRVALK